MPAPSCRPGTVRTGTSPIRATWTTRAPARYGTGSRAWYGSWWGSPRRGRARSRTPLRRRDRRAHLGQERTEPRGLPQRIEAAVHRERVDEEDALLLRLLQLVHRAIPVTEAELELG